MIFTRLFIVGLALQIQTGFNARPTPPLLNLSVPFQKDSAIARVHRVSTALKPSLTDGAIRSLPLLHGSPAQQAPPLQQGGLGIVISIRDGLLIVMNTMPNTPAARAGLRRFDHIVQIDNESTLSMSLQEATNRLRGAVGSSVNLMITRPGPGGFGVPRRFTLIRAVIPTH